MQVRLFRQPLPAEPGLFAEQTASIIYGRVPVARALMSILRFSFKIILGRDKDTFCLLAQAGTGILSGATPDKSVG